MYKTLLVGIGDFIGSVLKYLLIKWVHDNFVTFPISTLIANIIGSLFLDLTMYFSEYQEFFSKETRISMTIGVMGTFTTLSALFYKLFKLLDDSKSNRLFENSISGKRMKKGQLRLKKISSSNLFIES